MKKDISVVVPIYFEEENISPLYAKLIDVISKDMNLAYEIIFVNDGSEDSSVKKIHELIEQDKNIKLIDFSRNFGHQVAVTAGLKHVQGEVAVIIDADLQDPPALIEKMYNKYKSGYDVVYAKRKSRAGESFLKRKTAKLFYRILGSISEVDIPLDTGDYRLISRRVVEQLNNMPEKNRFIRGLVTWVGFKQTYVEYDRDERNAGETGYSLSKMIKFSLDGITSFSTFPLKIATIFGLLISGVSFIYILRIIYLKYFTEKTIIGWSSIMVSNLFLGGIILLTLGILGEYIGRIYKELKKRPQYIIKEKYGFDEDNDND